MKYYGFTCEECYWRGRREFDEEGKPIPDEPEFVSTNNQVIEVTFPHRCSKCDADYTRAKRTARALKKLASLSWHTHRQMPKLLTVGLPCKPGDDYVLLMKKLKKGWAQLRKRLKAEGVIAGKYVVECTHRICWDTFTHKWHPHIHAVVVCPYIRREQLIEFSKIPLKFGLGRINLRAVKNLKHVARYLSKYITKQSGYRSAVWGEMIGYYAPRRKRYKWRAKEYLCVNYHIYVLKSRNR